MSTVQEYAHLITASSNNSDVAKLAEDALKAPHIFFFASLLRLPALQALRSDAAHAWIVQVMSVLCHGGVRELRQLPSEVLQHVTPQLHRKACKLSVLALCANGGPLRLCDVRDITAVATPGDAEALLVDMMSDGLLRGRIDQRGGVLVLQEFAARDVPREDVAMMRERLEKWCNNCDAQIALLKELMKE
ncbi:COP9 signalosome complex subunit 7, variant [Trypanosoma theileri]|uniref:COP9 signalosome complex subunit 7, variant n=1 Tax=Trypanosoma theileri TaxID=67003 RepID=A0A1X0P4H5_9TRYP|nr:COP9 signalosome complex subunit 7, variant [Trypanosoma theileri]ORC91837.1 COP9 signalosome complex subunit 7, variant [Trypanosoma theileri]